LLQTFSSSKGDIAVFRPADGARYWVESSDGSLHGEQFGVSDDLITPGDSPSSQGADLDRTFLGGMGSGTA
jgi:hypothetical protein